MKFVTASMVFLTPLSNSAAICQERDYVWSEQFEVGESGDFELECYSDFDSPSLSNDRHFLNQQLELDYCATSGLTVGVYQILGQDLPEGHAVFGQFGIEGLYRFESLAGLPFDHAAYMEYSRAWSDPSSARVEWKLIIMHNVERLNFTINGGAEFRFVGEGELDPEFSGGISYRFMRELSGGIELFAAGADHDGLADMDLRGVSAGPTVSLSTPLFQLTLGISCGISRGADVLNFRAVIGIDL